VGIDFSHDRWQRIRRNTALWWSGQLERPLVQVAVVGRDPGRPEPHLPSYGFIPFYDPSVPPEAIVDRFDYDLSCRWFPGDAFPAIRATFGPGVAAAFLGAVLRPGDNTVWFHPAKQKEIADLRFTYDPDNPWLRRVRDLSRASVERWKGLVQVGMTDLGGALDILSTFRPAERLLTDLYDHPDHVKRLTWELHDLWFRYFDEINQSLQPGNPGYSCWPGMYSQQPHYMLQCDFAYMISPAMFEEFVKPELAEACRMLANPFYHLDGPGQLRHLDSLLEIPQLKGVQWVPGAGAPDVRHWPEVYRKVRRAGKLTQIFVNAEMDGLNALDVLADQLGIAKGIVLIGEVEASRQDELLRLLERYGAA
jgi:5-methyltetrahydrofolate--homocysteine methyltransferase